MLCLRQLYIHSFAKCSRDYINRERRNVSMFCPVFGGPFLLESVQQFSRGMAK